MQKQVLLVEDQGESRTMMKTLLQNFGYSVAEAADGYEAVEKAIEIRPDIILMDMAMPVMDGLESVRAMRQHDALATIPIIAVTAYGDFYRQRALDAGCTDVLYKPLDFEKLGPTIGDFFS